MKCILRFAMTTLTIFGFIIMHPGDLQIQTCVNGDKTLLAESYPITQGQSKGQVEFFRRALDKLGANSPEQVVDIWINGEAHRNGVFHYAVACDELKAKMIEEWGEPQDSFWIIGGSSPWLTNHEIVYIKKVKSSEYEAKIKFFWMSGGIPSTTERILIIVKDKDKWCVKEEKL